ncbi:MAG: protein kinase [Bdellovibrionia bacterium]
MSQETQDERQLCKIFEKVETNQGCSDFEVTMERDICQSLQNLIQGGNCSDEFDETQVGTLITCEAIYRGLTEKSCEHPSKHLFNLLIQGNENKGYFQSALSALCELGNEIPKNRVVFTEIRKNALLMHTVEPQIMHLFPSTPNSGGSPVAQKVRNLASHILKRLDELKIGDKKEFIFVNRHIKNADWISFFKNLVEIMEKHSHAWIAQSKVLEKPIRLDAGTLFEGITVPAGIIVFPDGRIVVFFDRLLRTHHRDRPLKPIGEGGFKMVYLAFDYTMATESLSDGFNDHTALVGGYIKSKKFDIHSKTEEVDPKLIQEVRQEFEAKKRWMGREGIAKSGDLVDLHGESKIKEKLILLDPYYPFNLIYFRAFLNNPSLESINGRSKEAVVFDLAKNLITGLSLLHGNQINHRDIKPENILVDADVDGRYQAFIADFGLALDLADKKNTDSLEKIKGTYEYMAPETLRALKQTGERVRLVNQNLKNDVWALGLTLYFLDKGLLHLPLIPRDAAPEKALKIDSYEDLQKLYGVNFSSRKPHGGTLQYIIYRMLDPSVEKRIGSQDALKLINELKEPRNMSSSTELLAKIKAVQSFSPKSKQIVFEKDWIHELHQIEKDSKKRFKKELEFYTNQ